jgi:hypothetical protein
MADAYRNPAGGLRLLVASATDGRRAVTARPRRNRCVPPTAPRVVGYALAGATASRAMHPRSRRASPVVAS